MLACRRGVLFHFAGKRGNLPRSATTSLGQTQSQSLRLSHSTAVFTWGVGTEGQLGHGKFNLTPGMFDQSYVQEDPRKLLKSKKFGQVAIGDKFMLGLTHDGDVFGWGQDFMGPVEAAGSSSSSAAASASASSSSSPPQSNEPLALPFPSGVKVKYIAAGTRHAAAIDTEGRVLTWGFGGDWYKGGGQLGHGSLDSLSKPKYIEWLREYGAKIKSVSCGNSHTIFLTTDGEVLSCGVGEYGRLGTGSSSNSTTPSSLASLINETIVQVAAGNSHSIALDKNGNMYTWGRNDAGQLGHSDTFIDIYSIEELPRMIESPALKGQTVCHVAAGNRRCAAVTHEGNLFVWGNKLQHIPTRVDPGAFGNLKVVYAACGGNSSSSCTAIITEDGSLWTMGDANSKILGWKGAKGHQTSPIKIGHGAWGTRRVLDIAGGLGCHLAAIVEIPE